MRLGDVVNLQSDVSLKNNKKQKRHCNPHLHAGCLIFDMNVYKHHHHQQQQQQQH